MDSPTFTSAETLSTTSHRGMSAIEAMVPTLTLLAHPKADRVGELASLPGLASGQTVALSRVEPMFGTQGQTPTGPLADTHLSREPLLLRGLPNGGVTIDGSTSRTRIEVDGHGLDTEHRLDVESIARGVVLVLGRRVALLLHLHPPMAIEAPDLGMVGASSAMIRLRLTVQAVADLRVPVLLRGESGTGKELLARAIHDHSPRCKGRYLAVNVAAVPSTLAAAELFGAARGAYTGADRTRSGHFQRADGGTLFLDEIGDIASDVQPLLLRVLESGEIQPVGGHGARPVDVRVVAATDADLEAEVEAGHFSRPLFHRLAGYQIAVPPLRDRRDDVGRLLYHLLRQELAEVGTPDALEPPGGRPWPSAHQVARLTMASWPGNVRELKNVARQLVIERRSRIPHLPLDVGPRPEDVGSDRTINTAAGGDAPASTSSGMGWRPAYRRPSEVDDDELMATLRCHRFVLKATADALGVSRGTLYNLIARCPEVRKATDLDADEIRTALEAAGADAAAAAWALQVSAAGFVRRARSLGLL